MFKSGFSQVFTLRAFLRFGVLALVMVVLGSNRVYAQAGIEAGLRYSSLKGVNTDNATERAEGWHFGLFYVLGKRGAVSFRPGLRYTDGDGFFDSIQATNFDGVKISSVEIPFDIRLKVPLPIIKPYIVAGPVISLPTSSDDQEFSDAFKSVNLAANVGGGIELKLGGLHLYPEINYSVGLSGVVKDGTKIRGVTFSNADQSKIKTFTLKLGIGFGR